MTEDRIKIAYLIDSMQIGGTENQLAEMVKRLDRSCFEPIIICIRESNPEVVQGLRCEVKEIPLGSFKSIRAITATIELIRLLKKRKIDIVQTFFIDSTVFGVIGAKLAGIDKIISSRRDLGFWQDRRSLRALGLVNRRVDRFWVNSKAVAQHLERMEQVPWQKIDVIYNGIALESFDRSHGADREKGGGANGDSGPIVGIVANLNRQVKRVDLFIRAAALVRQRCGSARFWIVGDGHLRPELEALGREVGLGCCLKFFGLRSNVEQIARNFDVGVLCSDSEGFSNSILEYFALGLPVVATNVGGNSEIIVDGEDGWLVGRGDHEALASSILELLHNRQLRKNMGENGRRKVALSFAWPAKIDEIQEYYRLLM